jgi:ParB-like chromosome segregation protein Spo0J
MDPIPLFERPESSLELVALADIQPWSASGARSATGKSIAALGLRGVVTLQQLAPGSQYRYKVIDGSRRLNKAREQELEHVQAEVLPVETDRAEAAALRLAMNLSRSPNAMQEAEALQELVDACLAEGIPEVEVTSHIAKTLGLNPAVIRQRLGLFVLPTVLRQGVEAGKVAAGVAAKIANLPRAQQEQLATELQEKGSLTGHAVKDVRRVKQEAVLAELPESLFAPLDDPRERARLVLNDFLEEGVTADELVTIVQRLENERRVF